MKIGNTLLSGRGSGDYFLLGYVARDVEVTILQKSIKPFRLIES